MMRTEIAVFESSSARQRSRDPGGVAEHDVASGLTGLGVAEPNQRIAAVVDNQPDELNSAATERLLIRGQEQPPQHVAGAPAQSSIQVELAPILQEHLRVLLVFERAEIDHPFVLVVRLRKSEHPAVHVPELHNE